MREGLVEHLGFWGEEMGVLRFWGQIEEDFVWRKRGEVMGEEGDEGEG